MSELAGVMVAVLGRVEKLVKPLSDDEMKLLASGDIQLCLLRPGYQTIEKSPALDRALKAIEALSDEEHRLLAERQASLKLLRKGDKVVSPVDPHAVALQVNTQASEGEIISILSADARLTAANLIKVADALGLPVPPNIKAKTALQLYIAEKAARQRGLPA